jgi:hypothetical protein
VCVGVGTEHFLIKEMCAAATAATTSYEGGSCKLGNYIIIYIFSLFLFSFSQSIFG